MPPPDHIRFFIDKSVGAPGLAAALQPAGWNCLIHEAHFVDRYDIISDPEIIAACAATDRFLITSDKDLPVRWITEIRAAGIGIFLLSNQNDGSDIWGARLLNCEAQVVEEAVNRERPFVARINEAGNLYLLDQIDQSTFKWKRIYHRQAP